MPRSRVRVQIDPYLTEWLGERILPIHEGDICSFVGNRLAGLIKLLALRALQADPEDSDEEKPLFKLTLEVKAWQE